MSPNATTSSGKVSGSLQKLNTGRKTNVQIPQQRRPLSLCIPFFFFFFVFLFVWRLDSFHVPQVQMFEQPILCSYYYFMSINNKLISELVMVLDTIYILMTQKFTSLARTISWIIDTYVQLPRIPKISKFKTKLLIFFLL